MPVFLRLLALTSLMVSALALSSCVVRGQPQHYRGNGNGRGNGHGNGRGNGHGNGHGNGNGHGR